AAGGEPQQSHERKLGENHAGDERAAEHERERPATARQTLLDVVELRLDVAARERYVSLDFSWTPSHRHVSSREWSVRRGHGRRLARSTHHATTTIASTPPPPPPTTR